MEYLSIMSQHPLHPKLVHFPIALIVSALIIQVLGISFKKDLLCACAWVMFVLSSLLTPLVIFSGFLEEERLHLHHPVLELHEQFAFYVMWGSLAALPLLWLLRKKGVKIFQMAFLSVLLVLSVLLGITAHHGGRLVFGYGVGVSQ